MSSYFPTYEQVIALAARCGAVPVLRRLPGDRLTPVSAFARVAAHSPRAFLLESVIAGERLGRYSFIGTDPRTVFRARGPRVTIEHSVPNDPGSPEVAELSAVADPLAELQRLLSDRRAARREDLARGLAAWPRFTGGAVGYAAYDLIRYYERLPNAPSDDRDLDDLDFGIYDDLIAFDHVNNTILVIAHARLDAAAPHTAYADACRRIDALVDRLNQPDPPLRTNFNLDANGNRPFDSTFTRDAFRSAVHRAIDYIRAGDIFQVVLSQRLRTTTRADPFDVYRALRMVNPSPFMFFVKSPTCTLVGASPEILCRVENGVVTNRPLAGTRRRGATPDEDARLEAELLADPKDRAEHIMLVDLGRNDVGRVAAPGTVALTDVMSIERYSHVMHISSNVTGRLAAGKTAYDALRTALPAGTVSGAPKIRAMQIIDELEPTRRGPYGGAVGYFDFQGNMDTCIALRTMVMTPGKEEWTADIQAGAGIVADSDPAAEYEETLNKARAMLTAVNMCGNLAREFEG